jgi:hypothetical protein
MAASGAPDNRVCRRLLAKQALFPATVPKTMAIDRNPVQS